MSNLVRGVVDLKAGDDTYSLLLDINALCEAEGALDMTLDVILAQYAAGTSARLVRALVWAGLRAHHPCGMEEAGQIVARAGFVQAKDAIERALVAALPEGGDENPPTRDRTSAADGNG